MCGEFVAVQRPDKLALFAAVALAAIFVSTAGSSAAATATATASRHRALSIGLGGLVAADQACMQQFALGKKEQP